MPSLGTQNVILGLTVLNQVVPPDSLVSDDRGVYYSKFFKKPSNHIWYLLDWQDNQSNQTFQKLDIDVRIRTGDMLPTDPSTGVQYNLENINAFIKANTPDQVDELLYKWHLGRSLLGVSGNSTTVNGNLLPTDGVFELGTAFNTTRLAGSSDAIFNYWSLPHIHNRSYIANNVDHNYIQLRIDLRDLDPNGDALFGKDIVPEMYNITISSLLQQGKESN